MSTAIDLFAGAGGFSTGAKMAGVDVVWAANHWPDAVRIHAANHPTTQHACQDLQQADFREAPAHDILLASPACQGHSRARGKEQPHHDQLRATAWSVVTCAEVHREPVVIVENVIDFSKWVLYPAWCAAMHALGYAIAPMVLDASVDRGSPQSRPRLFIVCTRSKHPIELKLPSRAPRTAADVIDFSRGEWSPVHRPGRAAKTLERVAAGRREFGDRFLIAYYGSTKGGRSIHRPIGTLTTVERYAVVDGDRMRMVSVEEGKAFMGFPTDYILPEDPKAAWKMVGNAVETVQACDLINAIKEAA